MVITRQLTDSASASTASDIQLGSCVTEIGQGAFSGYTNITEVEFPESLTTIGVGAFSDSSITSLDIPNSVSIIGSNAFNSCSNLANITVNAVTPPTLGEGAFDGSICAIIVPSTSYDSYIQSSWSTYKNRITYEGMSLKLNFISNSTSSILVCDGNSITKNAVDSIYFSDITATTIGSCATEIGQGAFSGKTLGNVTFEEGTTTIGDKAFYDINTNLAYSTITLPKSLTTIGSQVFHSNSADTRLEINAYGDSGLKLNKSSFYYRNQRGTFKLNLYNMPILADAFNTFDDYGFREVGVFGMSSIGNSAFAYRGYNNGLTSVTIGDGVRIIEDSAFQGNIGLTNLTLGNSLLDIGSSAFTECVGLTSVAIPNSVTSIGNYAFASCSGLTSITIGNSVTTIGEHAFHAGSNTHYNMERIVNMSDSVINVGDYAFNWAQDGTTYLNKLSSNIANIGLWAFPKCNFGNFVLPRTIRTIGDGAFDKCSGLTNVTIPSSVASVGASAFASSDIKTIIFENGILAIPKNCFHRCIRLTSATIGNSVTSIGDYAFYSCSALTSITIPSGVTRIGNEAFEYCSSLTSATIGNSVTSIGYYAFAGCSGLTSVTIPDSVTSIGNSAFHGCSGLTSATIGSGVTSIGVTAFYSCRGLTSVTVNATTPPTLGSYALDKTNNCPIYVPSASVDAYKSATNWSSYASRIQPIPNS